MESCGRQWSWHSFKLLFKYLPGEAEEYYCKRQSRDLCETTFDPFKSGYEE
jgi:hypothetical protein